MEEVTEINSVRYGFRMHFYSFFFFKYKSYIGSGLFPFPPYVCTYFFTDAGRKVG